MPLIDEKILRLPNVRKAILAEAFIGGRIPAATTVGNSSSNAMVSPF